MEIPDYYTFPEDTGVACVRAIRSNASSEVRRRTRAAGVFPDGSRRCVDCRHLQQRGRHEVAHATAVSGYQQSCRSERSILQTKMPEIQDPTMGETLVTEKRQRR